MSKMIEAMTKQIVRNEILEILAQAGSAGAGKKLIAMALLREHQNLEAADTLIDESLNYLMMKALIIKKEYENRRLGIRNELYFISAEGIDVLDGTTEISGLGD